MNAEFWQTCWQQNRTGFHQLALHPWLPRLSAELFFKRPFRTFVPLCGKSLDMLWWQQFGEVQGSELSLLACEQFFQSQQWPVQPTGQNMHQKFAYQAITLWQGDHFLLTQADLGKIDLVYDRAALIALPKEMRSAYAQSLKQLCPTSQVILLTLEYPQQDMSGPPFSVTSQEVRALFEGASIKQLCARSLTGRFFAQRKLLVSRLIERAYLIRFT